MATVNVYLTFNGNTEEAFNFYKSVFGGEFSYMGRFNEIPVDESCPPIPDNELNRIMHVSLPISKETVLMGSDSTSFSGNITFGNNFSISVNAESKNEANELFNKLAQNGTITMPLNDTFWGAYFGMLIDQFGIQWMVNFDTQV